MIRPATLGSTLISVGAVDKKQFPTAEIVKKGNLVAVVSPNEWEAISAARAVSAGTKWTAWVGLPGSENVTKTLRAYKWNTPSESRGTAADVTSALAILPHVAPLPSDRTGARRLQKTRTRVCARRSPTQRLPFLAVSA